MRMKWDFLLCLVLCCLCCTSCRTVENTAATHTRVDTVYLSKNHTDSIHIIDSVIIKERGDTVWMEKWNTKCVERIHFDTIYRRFADTLVVERVVTQPAERYVPKSLIWLLVITGGFTLLVVGRFVVKLVLKYHSAGIL